MTAKKVNLLLWIHSHPYHHLFLWVIGNDESIQGDVLFADTTESDHYHYPTLHQSKRVQPEFFLFSADSHLLQGI